MVKKFSTKRPQDFHRVKVGLKHLLTVFFLKFSTNVAICTLFILKKRNLHKKLDTTPSFLLPPSFPPSPSSSFPSPPSPNRPFFALSTDHRHSIIFALALSPNNRFPGLPAFAISPDHRHSIAFALALSPNDGFPGLPAFAISPDHRHSIAFALAQWPDRHRSIAFAHAISPTHGKSKIMTPFPGIHHLGQKTFKRNLLKNHHQPVKHAAIGILKYRPPGFGEGRSKKFQPLRASICFLCSLVILSLKCLRRPLRGERQGARHA